MTEISLDEALVAAMFNQDGIDATNAVEKLRNAKARVSSKLARGTGINPDFSALRSVDEIDHIMSIVHAHGAESIWA